MKLRTPYLALASVIAALSACGANIESSGDSSRSPVAVSAAPPGLTVYKNESCGCCAAWVEHMRHAGFLVDVRNVDNLEPVKSSVGVPAGKGSCHTAQVGRYFIEGHVPAEDVKRLLAERPDAKGLTVPQMPLGSPGMETADGDVEPYEVLLVANDGSTTVYARHGEARDR